MTKPLQVWGMTLAIKEAGYRQCRVIVAARSRAAAARAFDIPDSHLKDYGCPTGNAVELALAFGKPGTVFYALLNEAFRADQYKERV